MQCSYFPHRVLLELPLVPGFSIAASSVQGDCVTVDEVVAVWLTELVGVELELVGAVPESGINR